MLDETKALLEEGRAAGLHPGGRLCVLRGGDWVLDHAFGEAVPGRRMDHDSILLWLSSGKPFLALAVARLWERRELHLDQRVERFIPGFGANGKAPITIRHLLTHTGGFRLLEFDWVGLPWSEGIGRIAAMRLERGWVPGKRAGYHAHTSWYILAEIVRKIEGRAVEDVLRDDVFLPLGMEETFAALRPETESRLADRLAPMMQRDERGGAGSATGDWRPYAGDPPEGRGKCRPGGSVRGPVQELALAYEKMRLCLRNEGEFIVSPQTLEAMTVRQRAGQFDATFNHVMDWGLGFTLNSAQHGPETVPYSFGPYASLRTFGHCGNQSSGAFCDPENEVVVACVLNGMPGEVAHQARMRALFARIYEDLGLAEKPPA